MTPNDTWDYIIKHPYEILALLTGLVLVCFAGGVSSLILLRMWTNRIDLSRIISEPTGEASLSRLQFLIFTFVIALSLFLIVVGKTPNPGWPDKFPAEILTLLGISGSSYLVSKAIQAGSTPAALTISGPSDPLPPGGVATLMVSSPNAPSGTTLPLVTWSLSPAHGTIASSPPDKAIYIAPAVSPGAGTKVTIRAQATGFGDGIATITLAGEKDASRPALVVSATSTAFNKAGEEVDLTVSTTNVPAGTTLPPVTWSLEAPAHGTLKPIPPNKATYTAPDRSPGAGTKVVIHASAPGFDDGTVTLTLAPDLP